MKALRLGFSLLLIAVFFRQATCDEETNDEVKADILEEINAKRLIHQAQELKVDKKLEAAALKHAKQLVKNRKLAYSEKEKHQSELAVSTCKNSDEPLTGKEIMDKWYSEANLFSDSSVTLGKKAVDAKRFMQLVWKSSTSVGVAVQSFKAGKKTCYIVVTFITPKAKSLTADKDVEDNVLEAKVPTEEEPEKVKTEEEPEVKKTEEEPEVKKTEETEKKVVEEPEKKKEKETAKKESQPKPETKKNEEDLEKKVDEQEKTEGKEETTGSGTDYTVDYGNDEEDDAVSDYDDMPKPWE